MKCCQLNYSPLYGFSFLLSTLSTHGPNKIILVPVQVVQAYDFTAQDHSWLHWGGAPTQALSHPLRSSKLPTMLKLKNATQRGLLHVQGMRCTPNWRATHYPIIQHRPWSLSTAQQQPTDKLPPRGMQRTAQRFLTGGSYICHHLPRASHMHSSSLSLSLACTALLASRALSIF